MLRSTCGGRHIKLMKKFTVDREKKSVKNDKKVFSNQ